VGRGLRLNVRDEDIQEICAIVDHEKLKHQWLWEMVGAKVKKDVDQLSMFGDEDLPPKRKPQFVAKPELLIDIPKLIEEEKADFDDDLANIFIETSDIPTGKRYWTNLITPSKPKLRALRLTVCRAGCWTAPVFVKSAKHRWVTKSKSQSRRLPSRRTGRPSETSVRDIAAELLADDGIGSHELGYFMAF